MDQLLKKEQEMKSNAAAADILSGMLKSGVAVQERDGTISVPSASKKRPQYAWDGWSYYNSSFVTEKTSVFLPPPEKETDVPPRTKIQSWKYIAANPNDGEANTANNKQSWPTLMQLNKALNILDKKEQGMDEFYYP